MVIQSYIISCKNEQHGNNHRHSAMHNAIPYMLVPKHTQCPSTATQFQCTLAYCFSLPYICHKKLQRPTDLLIASDWCVSALVDHGKLLTYHSVGMTV